MIEWVSIIALTGWLVLAALMLGVALVSVPASRWALASRERYGVLTHSG